MKKHPPHLPQKTCSVKLRDSVCTIRIFIFYIVIALISGITGALVVFTWLIPNYNSLDFYLLEDSQSIDYNQNENAGSILSRRFQYNTVRIFDQSEKIYENFYPQNSFITRAALLSSNGWAVLYDPEFTYSKIKNWSVVDYKGVEHEIEKILYDSVDGFVYLKLDGDEFHVISFAGIDDFVVGDKMWLGTEDGLNRTIISGKKELDKDVYWATEDFILFQIDKTDSSGQMVLDDQGKILGFVDDASEIKEIWKVETQLSDILESSFLSENEIDFKGFFVRQEMENVPENEDQNLLQGFYVSQLKKYVSAAYVQAGDIILEINSRKVSEDNLAHEVLNLSEGHNLKVWRNGEIIDIIK